MKLIKLVQSKDEVIDKINELIEVVNKMLKQDIERRKYLRDQNGTEYCKNCGL